MGKPVDVVQGTVDLLIMKAVLEARAWLGDCATHQPALARRAAGESRVRSTQRSNGSSERVGSPRTGASQRTIGAPVFTGSRRPDIGISAREQANWDRPLGRHCTRLRTA